MVVLLQLVMGIFFSLSFLFIYILSIKPGMLESCAIESQQATGVPSSQSPQQAVSLMSFLLPL